MAVTKKKQALDILRDYSGANAYLLMLKRLQFKEGKEDTVGDFQIDYILRNWNREPQVINKVVRIADWLGEKKQNDWNTVFVPERIKILTYLGETRTTFNCYVQYRQSVPPVLCFLPKSGVITDFLHEDYKKINIDFSRYDRLSQAKDPNRTVREHQKEAVKFLLSRKKCILADDMGVGKSLEVSVAAVEGNFDSVVIICPASLKENWKRELMWYVPEKDITIIDSIISKTKGELEKMLGYAEGKSGKKKDELLAEAKDRGKWSDNRFVIVNYDILDEFYKIPKSWSASNISEAFDNSPLLQYIKDKKSLVIIDEAHKLSNTKSNRYKVVRDLIKRGEPESLYLVTGTPMTNDPQNLFCLLQLIDSPVADDWQFYMDRYCGATKIPAAGERDKWTKKFLENVGKDNWYNLTGKEKGALREYIDKNAKKINIAKDATNLEELKERISYIYLRRVKEDFMNIEKNIHELRYTLTEEQREEYDRLWDEYESAQLEAEPEKELNKELLEGAIYRGYISQQMVPHTKRLVDSILTREDKVIIACCYDKELYDLAEYYKGECVIFNGKMNSKQKDEAVRKFLTEPNIKVFIGNIQAAGVGLTLTVAKSMVFNNFEYVYGNNSQMQDRIYRIGQTRDVDIYYQMFRDTQYETMWDITLRKQTIFNSVIKKEKDKKK